MWLIYCPQLDLVQLQLKSRPTFCQYNRLDALWLLIDMMPEADEVTLVGEGHDALAVIFGCWEKILENVHHPLAKLCAEVVQYQMGVSL